MPYRDGIGPHGKGRRPGAGCRGYGRRAALGAMRGRGWGRALAGPFAPFGGWGARWESPPPWGVFPRFSGATWYPVVQEAPPASPLTRKPESGSEARAEEVLCAQVNPALCTGCGTCAAVCPGGAIMAGPIAAVDPRLCRGCGTCAAQCPSGAISLVSRPTKYS